MQLERLFGRSANLRSDVLQIIDLPLYGKDSRQRTCALLCSLSLEHTDGVLFLLAQGMLSSALVLHRAQFESTLRGIWALYGATVEQVQKLSAELEPSAEQAAKNLPGIKEMLSVLAKKGPPQAYESLQEFALYNLKALNSYTHAGLHPLRLQEQNIPSSLLVETAKNANGVAMLAAMQLAILTGVPGLQGAVLAVGERYSDVLRWKTEDNSTALDA